MLVQGGGKGGSGGRNRSRWPEVQWPAVEVAGLEPEVAGEAVSGGFLSPRRTLSLPRPFLSLRTAPLSPLLRFSWKHAGGAPGWGRRFGGSPGLGRSRMRCSSPFLSPRFGSLPCFICFFCFFFCFSVLLKHVLGRESGFARFLSFVIFFSFYFIT